MSSTSSRRAPAAAPALACLLALVVTGAPAHADTLTVPGQFDSIQAAVDAAAPGDIVSVQAGVYVESVVVTTPGLSLVGNNAVIDPQYQGPCLDIAGHDVSVSGFTLRNGEYGIRAVGHQLDFSSNTVLACVQDGILVYGLVPNLTGNRVNAVGARGIRVLNPTLAPCPVPDCSALDAPPAPGGPLSSSVRKNKVSQCDEGGIALFDVAGIVEKNQVTSCGGDGIWVSLGGLSGPPPGAVCLLRANRCSGNAGDGLHVEDFFGSAALIKNNKLSGNGEHGLRASGFFLTIERNTAAANAGAGIAFSGQASVLKSNKLQRNGDRGLDAMGFAAGGSDPNGTDNTLSGNVAVANGRDGIYAATGSFTIRQNACRFNAGDGIDLDRFHDSGPDTGATSFGSAILQNVVVHNNHEGIDNSGVMTRIDFNLCHQNDGADIAGMGDGLGSAGSFEANNFGTGGADTMQVLDL